TRLRGLQDCYPESMRAARVISAVLTSISLVAARAEAQVSVGAALGPSTQGEGVSDQPSLGPPLAAYWNRRAGQAMKDWSKLSWLWTRRAFVPLVRSRAQTGIENPPGI